VGEFDGHHYFSMDFVTGRSLSEIVRDAPCRTIKRHESANACRSRAVLHDRGVYRDLKPSNVLIDDHKPLITDFDWLQLADGATAAAGASGAKANRRK
jgi:serine/threonine protein kinase